MATVIKADGIISNPKLGKIDALQLLTTESCIRSTDTELMGSTTDLYGGGFAYSWDGLTGLFVLSSLGLTNTLTTASGTTYLGMPATKDIALSFEAGAQGSEIYLDMRRVRTGDNYCYRLRIKSSSFAILRRVSSSSTLKNMPALVEGDKVYITLKGGNITIYVNGVEVYTIDDSSYTDVQRAGVIAMSKGATDDSGHTYIKNLQVLALS
ncbi:hypothetical protein [Klebsiella pneumoniae]|uniref:hypothetical protein n=1 Tax=Klebsiella pneumoniae TaxID=573 RepID=UPI0004E12756|nr:hypothetical protein [Klebsiella pneumoniae]HBY8183959.1 hypothetical protein [Klebsiella pneumoniae]